MNVRAYLLIVPWKSTNSTPPGLVNLGARLAGTFLYFGYILECCICYAHYECIKKVTVSDVDPHWSDADQDPVKQSFIIQEEKKIKSLPKPYR